MLPAQSKFSFPNSMQSTNTNTNTFPSNSIQNTITNTFPSPQSVFPSLQNTITQSTFPGAQQNTFTRPAFPTITIGTEFNLYTEVETCFTNIKTLSIFVNSQEMSTTDFNVINVVSLDCLEKLSTLSTIYIKKMNECNLTNTKLNTMYDKHLELITKIIKFNNIYNEVSNNLKQLASLELSPEQKQFTFDEIFNRYKLNIYEIMSDIKIINTYKTIIN